MTEQVHDPVKLAKAAVALKANLYPVRSPQGRWSVMHYDGVVIPLAPVSDNPPLDALVHAYDVLKTGDEPPYVVVERAFVEDLRSALMLLDSHGVQTALRHARKHRSDLGLEEAEMSDVNAAYADWSEEISALATALGKKD